ncbi:MAG: aminopeptidase P N-terminal domain-containing protein [Gemmatimonadales bacterium]
MTVRTLSIVVTLGALFRVGNAVAQAPATSPVSVTQTPVAEYAARRTRIMETLSDGILLLHARSAEKDMEQWGFVQDPSFLYFTGLSDLPGAILALDGPGSESRLFVPPPPMSFGFPVDGLVPAPGGESADKIGVDAVESWDQFAGWLDTRLSGGVKTLYVDEPRRPEATGVPSGLRAVAGPLAQWRASLEARFPDARFASAKASIQAMRWVKSHAEVGVLRRNAEATAAALVAVARTIRPGMTQREAEARIVAACIESGAQGPSFWPWIMAGPNAHVDRLVHAFFHYDQLDRVMQPGELVRVDIGCASGLYGSDVGRTLPVSGTFSAGQREAWNLLIRAYRAGMDVMAAGVPLDTVRAASTRAVADARGKLRTSTGRQAADAMLEQGNGVWHIHGVGIESGEDAGSVLESGSVVAFEPMIEVGSDAFYLEDMILITSTGFEVLSKDLPYTAQDIEAVMRPRNGLKPPSARR